MAKIVHSCGSSHAAVNSVFPVSLVYSECLLLFAITVTVEGKRFPLPQLSDCSDTAQLCFQSVDF